MNSLLEWVAPHGVLLVFAATLLARIGLPVPAAPVLVVAGALAVSGGFGFGPLAAAAIAANLIGDALWFWAGRRYGHRVMRLLCRVSLSPDSCVRQSENFISRWGGSALIAAKFVPGVSTIAAPMAGALGMSVPRFLSFDLVGAILWTLLFTLLGALFSRDIEAVLDTLASVGLLTGGVVVGLLGLYLVLRYVRRRRFLLALSTPRITVAELRELIAREPAPTVIDVRSPASVQLDPRRVPGALPIELRELAVRAAAIPVDALIVLYCNCPNEVSAGQAARLLAQAGRPNSRLLEGGLDAWAADGGRVEMHAVVPPGSAGAKHAAS